MVNPAKQSVDGAELGSWLRTIGIGYYDPTWPFRSASMWRRRQSIG